MKRLGPFVSLAALTALAASGNALAVGGIAQVAIVDRSSGVELVPHYFHGEYWVAGTPGAAYSIEIRNRIGERLLAVTSVDGVNVISGATAAWDQTGYVFDPGAQYQITGWRKSDAEVAAFTFTDSSDSYAGRTGRPANIGVIGVAVFRERQPLRVETPNVVEDSSLEHESRQRSDATPHEAAAPAPAPSAPSSTGSRARAGAASKATDAAAAPETKLGTGHGEREASYVNRTDFNRLQSVPNEVIRIHYDSLNNLVAMGIIKRARPSIPTANPFPGSAVQQYAPDPPPG